MFIAPLLAALALAPSFVSAQLGKGSLFGPFDALHQATRGAMDGIPSSGVVSKRSVDVPQICQERVQGYGMNEASTGITCNGLEAMEVQYDDCGEPWTLCRCGDAQISWDQLIERVGKVPAGSRSYVRGVVATQAPGCSGLCFDGNFIRLHGDCDMFVLMHEVGHAVDDGYPDWQPFVDAINKDSCVPDEYGNTNKVEEFAQMFAMVSGGWFSGNIPADFSCLKNQFDTLWNDWRIQEALGSPTCIQSRKPSINFAPNSAKFGNSFTSSLNKVNVTIPSGLKSLSEAAHFH